MKKITARSRSEKGARAPRMREGLPCGRAEREAGRCLGETQERQDPHDERAGQGRTARAADFLRVEQTVEAFRRPYSRCGSPPRQGRQLSPSERRRALISFPASKGSSCEDSAIATL